MTMKIIRLGAPVGVAWVLAFAAATAFAQGSPAETQERYRRERAACLKGGSNQPAGPLRAAAACRSR